MLRRLDSAHVRESRKTPVGERTNVKIRIRHGAARLVTFDGLGDAKEHFAIVFGSIPRTVGQPAPLVRIHSECITGDLFGSARCDCGAQLDEALSRCSTEGGVVVYLRQEGRGIGLYNKLDAYDLQDHGFDTIEANEKLGLPADDRDFQCAADMLKALGITKIRLLTNNPKKSEALLDAGITLEEVLRTGVYATPENRNYLRTKVEMCNHNISLSSNEEDFAHVST